MSTGAPQEAQRGERRTKPRPGLAGETNLGHGSIIDYRPNFFSARDAARFFKRLEEDLEWSQPTLRVMGREVKTPRCVGYMADSGELTYRYSGVLHRPDPWHPVALQIKVSKAFGHISPTSSDRLFYLYGWAGTPLFLTLFFCAVLYVPQKELEAATGFQFNSCLLNLYRNGTDSLSYHSDSEQEYGVNPTIASVSLGTTRAFLLRRNSDHGDKISFALRSGDLLIMTGTTQQHWMHSIPKRAGVTSPRINLTFRWHRNV